VLHIDVGGEEPLETKGEEVLPQAGVISMCAKGAREVWLQMPPISVNNYWIIGESGSRPLEGFSFKAQSLSFGPGTWPGYVRIAAHFALLGTQYTVDGARLVFTSKDYGYRKHITLSAEGCERTIASEELQYRDLGERVMRYSFFGLCGRMPASGRWTVNFEDEFYKAKETDWEFWLQPQFASKAYLMAIAPGAPEDPVVISRMPAELFLVDASETKVTRHPLMSISPESLDPQRLDSLSDMVYTPDGSAIMAASSIHPEVYRIDPSTGRTSLWVAGRGEGLDDESLGQPNTSHLRLAIGGDPVPSPRAGWVVISGK
jgi:hypothetical protein